MKMLIWLLMKLHHYCLIRNQKNQKKQISSCHTELNKRNEEIYEFRKKVQSLEKSVENPLFSFKNTNAKYLKCLCGVEVNIFKWILVLVKPYNIYS